MLTFVYNSSLFREKLRLLLFFPVLASLLSGCAGSKGASGPVFFPPAPNPPRVQYLMKISDSQDIEDKKSSFSLFVQKSLEGDTVKPIKKPYGVTTRNGKIYICDVGGATVSIIDPPRKTFEYLKGNFSVGKLKKPINIAVDGEGAMYIADIERKEILVYDAAGNFKNAFGKELDMKPTDVAVDGKYLYVVDIGHSEVKVLDSKTGKLLDRIGKGSEQSEGLALPTNFAVDGKGFIYVTNTMTGKVMKFDRDGHLLLSFGKLGDGFGQFGRPKGVAVDDAGRIYVADSAHQNVQIFNEKGRLLMFFGDPGTAPEGTLNLPSSVAVSRDNLDYFQKFADPSFQLENVIFVINQYGPNKVAVYGLGQQKSALDDAKGVQEGSDGTKELQKKAEVGQEKK